MIFINRAAVFQLEASETIGMNLIPTFKTLGRYINWVNTVAHNRLALVFRWHRFTSEMKHIPKTRQTSYFFVTFTVNPCQAGGAQTLMGPRECVHKVPPGGVGNLVKVGGIGIVASPRFRLPNNTQPKYIKQSNR